MRYVIIGNSAAAIGAVEGIRRIDQRGSIVVISEEPYPAYSRPLISYYLEGKVDERGMGYRESGFYEQHGVDLRLGVKAVKLLTEQRRVLLDDGNELGYDRVLVSTGSIPALPPIMGLDKKGVFRFNRWEDIDELRKAARPNLRAVVMGAGLTGLKAAEALSNLGLNVTVVESSDRVLPSILDSEAASLVQGHLEEHGLTLLTNTSVVAVHGGEIGVKDEEKMPKDKPREYPSREQQVESIELANGFSLQADIVIMATGVRPNTALAKEALIKVNRGILVNQYLETSAEGVYAAGDVVEALDVLSGKPAVIANLPNAYRQGEIAGMNMAGAKICYPGSLAVNSVSLFGLAVAAVGRSNEDGGDVDVLRKADLRGKTYRRLTVMDDKLLGFIAIGDVARVGILTGLVRNRSRIAVNKDRLLGPGLRVIDLPTQVRMSWQQWERGVLVGNNAFS